ncbi:mitochondrial 18 KDa protein-domain-containing protein [Tuber brumale]|nr:mitochondrial 18 KDa protein-domain-containing protein [Tuber brumale]
MSARAPSNPDPPKTGPNDSIITKIYEGEAPDTTDTNVRWAAYANRIRTIVRSTHRYVAYTSDIGESFRPVTYRNLVRAAYGVSWAYLTGDVMNEGYKAYLANQATLRGGLKVTDIPVFLQPAHMIKNRQGGDKERAVQDEDAGYAKVELHPRGNVPFLEDYRTVMAQRAVFQSLASMALPAFTIHSIVRYSGLALRNHKNPKIRTWGPVGLGLAVVPALPYIFDHPVEQAVEWVFEKGYHAATGRSGVSQKEKEL